MRFKDCIREGFGLLLAVGLCIFILHPYILDLALSLALRFRTDNSTTSYNICIAMEVIGMVPTGFIMGLIVSLFWKSREIRGSFIASILMGTYYVGVQVFAIIETITSYLDGEISRLFSTHFILLFLGELVMLFLFSFLAGKLVQRIRCLKSRSI